MSTGPRTPAGKSVSAGNAVRHGVFARLPVLPGECPAAWEAHRTGVLDSLRPEGLLEVTFAERAALLLWQLGRLARFQAAALTAAVEDAGLPAPAADAAWLTFNPPGRQDDDQLKVTRQNFRLARRNYAEVWAVAGLARRLADSGWGGPVAAGEALAVLNWAYDVAADHPLRRADPPYPGHPAFLARLGLPEGPLTGVAWTAELVREGVILSAEAVGGDPGEFWADVVSAVEGRAAALGRQAEQLEAEADGLDRRWEKAAPRAADAALLPAADVADRVVKYEKHLHGMLTSTLHELERLQARRNGSPLLPPAVADLTVLFAEG